MSNRCDIRLFRYPPCLVSLVGLAISNQDTSALPPPLHLTGINMVDIFGVVAGAAGLFSFIGQLHTGIHALQKVRKHAKEAQEQFNFLEEEVERLNLLIHQVHINASSSNDGVLQKLIPQCQSSCNEVVQGLKKLEQSLSKRLKSNLQKKVPKALAFKNWKGDLEALEGKIKRANEDLMT